MGIGAESADEIVLEESSWREKTDPGGTPSFNRWAGEEGSAKELEKEFTMPPCLSAP